ncbi:MAG: hypothetical protein IPH94_09240 [Saprospiraceae bacterium]|nr:hypothetical protein [Saprospiraceae bacterium]
MFAGLCYFLSIVQQTKLPSYVFIIAPIGLSIAIAINAFLISCQLLKNGPADP